MENTLYRHIKILVLIYLLFPFNSSSQNETNNWYFGDYAGFNFNNGQFSLLNDGNMSTPAGCSSISNNNGELLFYTNGQTVWNSTHEIMTNGSDLNADIENNQTSIIIPDQNNDSVYYILTTKVSEPNPGIFYSRVEFNQNNPLGIVTHKNSRITYSSVERLTAVHSPQTNSIKVVGLGRTDTYVGSQLNSKINKFYIINVGEGITLENPPYLIKTLTVEQTFLTQSSVMKFSPNGEYLAIGDDGNNFSGVYIYKFDTLNNNITPFRAFNAGYIFLPIPIYGIEFSADSQIIYFSGNTENTGYLHRYLLNSLSPLNDKILIDSSQEYRFGSLQLASNGKIYAANFNPYNPYFYDRVSVINNPENLENSDYIPLGIDLGIPNSTKGLPNFICSYMRNRIIVKNGCVSDIFEFTLDAYDTIESAYWEFGDGSTSSILNPTHQYDVFGEYTIKATITIDNKEIQLFKTIEVYPLPELDNSKNLVQCDLNDDGFSFFNLFEIDNNISNPWPEEITNEFHFYLNLNDAQNGEDEIPDPDFFQNTSNPQEIFVKIINSKGCSSISSFLIEVQQSQQLGYIQPVISCEGSDNIYNNGIAYFNLTEKTQEIIEQFNVPEENEVYYYPSLEDALANTNRIIKTLTSASTVLWVKIINDSNDCLGITTLELVVNNSIPLDIKDSYQICTMLPNQILDGNIENDSWQWSNELGEILSGEREFELSTPGKYQITVTKQENGIICSKTEQFLVLAPNEPTFNNIEISDTNIFISINGKSNYEFSLDNLNFYGEGLSYTFYNVEPGVINIYVRDIDNCEATIQTQVSFIYFPKYFSPNGDGKNDKWTVYGVNQNLYKEAEILIFDRYGRNLSYINLTNINKGWDGLLNGELLPNSDYWYKASLINRDDEIIEKNGHFTLKR